MLTSVKATAVRGRRGDCQSLVIGRDTGGVLNPLKANGTMTAVFREWQNEDQNVRYSWANVEERLPAPHDEENMLPSWLGA